MRAIFFDFALDFMYKRYILYIETKKRAATLDNKKGFETCSK